VDRADVARWLAHYVHAWRSYDREAVLGLFADSASYRYRPQEEPLIGSQRIADDWLSDRDEPGSWDAAFEPIAVDGDTAVAVGSTTYTNPDGSVRAIYDNCFVMRFDPDGRCREFTEWYVQRPA
jgi:ketosteroid isomerase-like protein